MAEDGPGMSASNDTKEKIGNKFVNDGSFLEMFKKKMEEQKAKDNKDCQESIDRKETAEQITSIEKSNESESESEKIKTDKTNVSLLVGKRRSGGAAKVLKTGIVKKPKQDEDESNETKDGWSKYMAEVNKYKSKICTDEDKTRPLVK